MKKLLYADSKGLLFASKREGFITTEDAFLTYRHPVLVDSCYIEEGDSVTKSIVVYNVSKGAEVTIMKDEKILHIKDLAKVMNPKTWTNIIVLNDNNNSLNGSLGYFASTKIEGMMIISNMSFSNGELVIKAFEMEVMNSKQ